MNVTEEKPNQGSVSIKMYDELAALPAYLETNETIRAVVFQGEGEAFAAGTNINQFKNFLNGEQGLEYENRVGTILDALSGIRVPTIAVVNGPAVGAGLAVAATCDLVIATPSAFFGAPIARRLGNCLPPPPRHHASASTPRSMISAQEAQTAGFVHRIVDRDGFQEGVPAFTDHRPAVWKGR